MADSSTSYAMLDFISGKKFAMDISNNWVILIAKVCLGFAIYDVHLPDIYTQRNFYWSLLKSSIA